MLELDSVKKLAKINTVCTDNNVFRLHYKVTVPMLLFFSILVSSRQYIGDPINCYVDGVPGAYMDTYCWILSTFTVPSKLNGRVGKDVIHPGVADHVDDEDEVRYHQYYQWVCFVLFIQAMLFYAPRYLWRTWEGGRMAQLVLNLDCPIMTENWKNKQKGLLLNYFAVNLHQHNFYAVRFFICEVLNFINVVAQIFFIDYFLDGEFSWYGLNVLKLTKMVSNNYVEDNPMNRVFPKLTKCILRNYGPSGTIQKFDGLCVLPLNVVNEKIYVFLWFWFIILTILSGFALIYRVAVILSPRTRLNLLRAKSGLAPYDQIKTVARKCRFGDWFVLYQLGKNIDPVHYKEVIADLAQKFAEKGTV